MADLLRMYARAASGGNCTKETCPASRSVYGYAPSWNFNFFFAMNFAISGLVFYHQSFIWPKWRAFSLACAAGSFMEAGGYVGRLMLSKDPFSDLGFKLNIVLLTIAPALVSAAIYLTLKRAVVVFGQRFSRLPPTWYAYIFVGCDIVSIILQGAGGAISAIATQRDLLNQGVDIMIAGLVFQVFTLTVFFGLAVDFVLRCVKNRRELNPGSTTLVRSSRFQLLIAAVIIAFLAIYARCCYRVAELSGGWGNKIMRKEGEFIILDSDMCTLAFLILSLCHPGYLFREDLVRVPDEKNVELQDNPMEISAPTTWAADLKAPAYVNADARQHRGSSTVRLTCQRCGHRSSDWI